MEKVVKHKRLIIATAIILVAVILMSVYWQTIARSLQPSPSPSPSPVTSPSPFPSLTPSPLNSEEIREYEGKDLSSVGDFKENSIKGPQYINASTYRLTITGLVNKTLEYTYGEVINGFQKYQKVVTLHCVEGWSVTILWEGFLLFANILGVLQNLNRLIL